MTFNGKAYDVPLLNARYITNGEESPLTATAHLDLARRMALLDLARVLAAEGRAVLAVTHDLALAARACDRIALLAGGRVHALGPPAAVLTPARIRQVFAVEAEVLHADDGAPVVLPRGPASADPGRC